MNTHNIAVVFLVLFCQYGVCFASGTTAVEESGKELRESSADIHIGMPLKDGLAILRMSPDVSSIDLHTGDIAVEDGYVIFIASLKNSNDALFVISNRKNEQEEYKISELMLYRNWKKDCTKPKKKRKGEIESVYTFILGV